jgi:hypothetical protein
MNTYQVFNHNNTLLGEFPNAAAALKEAMVYRHQTGNAAYVEQVTGDDEYQAADDLADWQAQGGEE